MSGSYDENMAFEAEVRRVAEAVWNQSPGHCQPMHYPNDPVVREIDGIARLRDITHLIMATTSTRLDKIRDDVKKLNAAEKIEKSQASAVSKWLITEKQLDAQHIEHARQNNVTTLTLGQFQRRFFDGSKYISLRRRCAFGSARDPISESISIPEDAYVELPMRVTYDSRVGTKSLRGKGITLAQMCRRLISGETIVLRAPFGSGKSLTTREMFNALSAAYIKDSTSPVPIALNLREHWGEDYCDEILERHARTIGYSPREEIVIAWRATMCCLLLDGFDELAAQTLVRTDNKNFMKDARRKALKGVQELVKQAPGGVGIFICGRNHYFDGDSEMTISLGLTGKDFIVVDLEEFTEESAAEFLRRNGINSTLPAWLPRKPLILGYLLRASLFEEIASIDSSKGFGFAWDTFVRRICEREAALEGSSMDPETIRAVLERLAESVRTKSSGTGPITGNDLADAYTVETGQAAGEGVLAQLQRLPGLAQRDSEPGARSFVDVDMLGALQGGAFSRQALAGFRSQILFPISDLSERAISMAVYKLAEANASPDTLIGVIEQLLKRSQRERISTQLAADCLAVAVRFAIDLERDEIDFRSVTIDGACFGSLPLDEICIKGAIFRNSTFANISFGSDVKSSEIRISSCLISKVSGVVSRDGLPENVVGEDCEIEEFDSVGTNSAVLRMNISPQIKALLTILRKLYKQSGSGRKTSAFSRGITQPDVLRKIDKVLEILQKHQFVSIYNAIVHPVRKQASRVEEILASPALSDDPMVIEVRNIP